MRANDSAGQGDSAKVAVVGAGVIGQVLAARLHERGVDVVLVARGASGRRLRDRGVRLRTRGRESRVPVPVADVADPGERDVVVLCTRATDLASVLPLVDAMGSPLVVTMMHLGDRWPTLRERVGEKRLVRAFPGLGGFVDADGTITWLAVGRGQPTTVDGAAARSAEVVALLRRSGLLVAATPDMDGWMDIHVVFVAAMGAGIVRAGGHGGGLAGDPGLLRLTVDAVREGLGILRARGTTIRPRALGVLFLRMPRWFAVAYWRRALPGPVGEVAMAPHCRVSSDDELPVLWRTALDLVGSGPDEVHHPGAYHRLVNPLLDPSAT